MLDPDRVRPRFPALATTHRGRPVVFADAPGGTQVPDSVIEAVSGWYREGISNTHGAFPRSEATDDLIRRAREAAADLVGAEPTQIVFGPNATTLLFHVARALARTLAPGDELVVTRLDHDANIRPWVIAADDAGAAVRWVDVRTDDATLDLESLARAVTDRTRLLAVTMASNAVGSITRVTEAVERAHAVGALVALDAVHAAQHRPIDVAGWDVDLAVVSAYKVFGPHVGILAARGDLLRSWTPDKVVPAPDEAPDRWETGTQNHEALAGTIAAVEYLAELGRTFGAPADGSRRSAVVAGFEAIVGHERLLSERFLRGVAELQHVELIGITEPARAGDRTPTFAVRCAGRTPLEVAKRLADEGIWSWDGHYYAIELFRRLGLLVSGGAVRIGFCHYHRSDDVDRVLEALRDLA